MQKNIFAVLAVAALTGFAAGKLPTKNTPAHGAFQLSIHDNGKLAYLFDPSTADVWVLAPSLKRWVHLPNAVMDEQYIVTSTGPVSVEPGTKIEQDFYRALYADKTNAVPAETNTLGADPLARPGF